jgi:protein dithiol oxidoreductase (disulfide-forming)
MNYHKLLYILLLLATTMLNAAEYKKGTHYKLLSTPSISSSTKVQVQEIFWYGCAHCFSLESDVKKWLTKLDKNKVEFTRIPAAFGGAWDLHAQFYYTGVTLKIIDKIHTPMFNAIHIERNRSINCTSVDACADNYAQFVKELNIGVTAKQFSSMFSSFGVLNKMNQSKSLMKQYKVTGVPTFVIAGKYITGVQMAGSNENLFGTINMLINKELQAATTLVTTKKKKTTASVKEKIK